LVICSFTAKRPIYGKTYDTAVSETGLGYQTIANLKSVARKVDISRRRENLSFGHHAEVAALPAEQQQRLLDLADGGVIS
jgi:hypothetical protein